MVDYKHSRRHIVAKRTACTKVLCRRFSSSVLSKPYHMLVMSFQQTACTYPCSLNGRHVKQFENYSLLLIS